MNRIGVLGAGLLALLGYFAPASALPDECPRPIVLVHGTGATGSENWSWSYGPALESRGCEVKVFDMPRRAIGDIRHSAQALARAVAEARGNQAIKVDLIGHSQGGLIPRYFLARSWKLEDGVWIEAADGEAGTDMVENYIGLASPNHGTIAANVAVDSHLCTMAACWQMRHDLGPVSGPSPFIVDLNSDETPGDVSYTNLYSATDELVQPVGTSALDASEENPKVANLLLQDICPGRVVDHVFIVADALAWALTLDALAHDGPADPARLPPGPGGLPAVCAELFYPDGFANRFPQGNSETIFTEFAAACRYSEEPPVCTECDPDPEPCPDDEFTQLRELLE